MDIRIRNAFSKFLQIAQTTHRAVKIAEPWGILIAVIALVITLMQFNTDRKVREATMIGLVSERLEATRALQHAKGKVARFNTGQVRMLEIMAGLGIDLTDMDLSEIYLRRIKLPGADLTNVDLVCSNLTRANLNGVNLTDADLTWATLFKTKIAGTIFNDADLYGADLNQISFISGVDFTKAKFSYTRLRNMDLRKSKGLTDSQVRNSCGYDVKFPPHITETLVRCTSDQKQEQKCDLK